MRRTLYSAAFALAMLMGGSMGWQAVSATGPGSGPGTAVSQEFSPVQPAACARTGPKCPPGYQWVCGPAGHCRCAPC